MPRAIKLTCPECNAALDANAGAATVTCEYCGTRAHIQQRTRILQRPAPLRDLSAGERVALEQRSGAKALFAVLVAVLLVGVAPVAVCGLVCGGSIELFNRLSSSDWDCAGAVLRDLNGDGTPDIIGRTAKLKPEHVMLLAAFDGKNGDRLWESEALGPRGDLFLSPMGVAGDLAVLGTGGPGLVAVSLKDGAIRWRTRLGEKVEQICAGDARSVRVRTADERLWPVALASGKAGEAEQGGAGCEPLPQDNPRESQPHRGVQRTDLQHVNIEGMDVDVALRHVPSGATVALGARHPGTEVPMVACYRLLKPPPPEVVNEPSPPGLQEKLARALGPDKAQAALDALKHRRLSRRAEVRAPTLELVWKADVPGVDPFTVETDAVEPTKADLNDKVLVVAYETKQDDVYRLTAFELKSGKRRWDVELPGERNVHAVVVTPTLALITRSPPLQAVDLASGEVVFTIE